MPRVLGIDYGSKRIGLAVSDEDGLIAMPLTTLEKKGLDTAIARIAELVRERGVERVVVGLPLRLDGSEGPESRRAREFAARLSTATGLPAVFEDERLTTAEATRALCATGARARDRKARVDAVAATLILQSYLDGPREAS